MEFSNPLFNLSPGRQEPCTFQLSVDHQGRVEEYSGPADLIGIMDLLDISADIHFCKHFDDQILQAIAAHTTRTEYPNHQPFLHAGFIAQMFGILFKQGQLVFFFHARRNIILFLYGLVKKVHGVGLGEVVGCGGIHGQVKAYQADVCCTYTDGTGSGGVHGEKSMFLVFEAVVEYGKIQQERGQVNYNWEYAGKNTLCLVWLPVMNGEEKKIVCSKVRALFTPELRHYLSVIAQRQPSGVYLAGGTVRDLLLGRSPADVDVTVACHARTWARALARLTGGAYVELGREEDAARVVWRKEIVDFSSFRSGATSIEQELTKRDLTINALGLCIDPLIDGTGCEEDVPLAVIDPLGGVKDLRGGLIRFCSTTSVLDDPLRILRVFRFAATLGYAIQAETLADVQLRQERIEAVAAERVAHELALIMESRRAHHAFMQMAETGLLFAIIPELRSGVGMDQPASHHLDVFDHLLETLHQMESILQDPGRYFPADKGVMESWLEQGGHRQQLKWAALFHDVGKPVTFGINEDKGGRITFYKHDLQGADLFVAIAGRLRWSREDTRVVASLIASHMRPFFLANNLRAGKLTLKACLRLVRKAGAYLPGLFMLAMADALAGKGEGSPEEIEQEVAALFERLQKIHQEHVAPVRAAPPLLTGQDLIEELHLEPGPLFRRILEQVEEAQMEHRVSTRKQALALASSCAQKDNAEQKIGTGTHNPYS